MYDKGVDKYTFLRMICKRRDCKNEKCYTTIDTYILYTLNLKTRFEFRVTGTRFVFYTKSKQCILCEKRTQVQKIFGVYFTENRSTTHA